MTQAQLDYILKSDLPVHKKSELIKGLYDAEHDDVLMFKEGGEVKEEVKIEEQSLPQNEQDMTLDDLLKLNISDSAKQEITEAFKAGGNLNFTKQEPVEVAASGTSITIVIEPTSESKELQPTETIKIGNKEYDVEIADTEEARKDGLSRVTSLDADEGMLFVFEDPTKVPFTMQETSIPLDIIFIDEEGEVIEVHSVEAGDEKPVECSEEFVYVLEVNKDSGVEEGDILRIDDDHITDEDKQHVNGRMLVLNSEGDVQATIEPGCRIFSRISTRKMIKKALTAYKEDTEEAYKKVGRYVCFELNQLDKRSPQYTDAPENNNKKEE